MKGKGTEPSSRGHEAGGVGGIWGPRKFQGCLRAFSGKHRACASGDALRYDMGALVLKSLEPQHFPHSRKSYSAASACATRRPTFLCGPWNCHLLNTVPTVLCACLTVLRAPGLPQKRSCARA